MDTQKFIKKCIEMLVDYFNKNVDVTNRTSLKPEDVYVVWLGKTLGNNKALLSTNVSDGMYYKITYNEAKKEFYLMPTRNGRTSASKRRNNHGE